MEVAERADQMVALQGTLDFADQDMMKRDTSVPPYIIYFITMHVIGETLVLFRFPMVSFTL